MSTESPLDVAIIGCGIVGIKTGLGLMKRNINVTLYEQASELREIGAGLGFMTSAIECMRQLDPRIADVVNKVGVGSEAPLRWIDALTEEDVRLRPKDHLHDMELLLPDLHIKLCHRAELLAGLIKLLPPGVLRLGKRLESLDQSRGDGKVHLTFSDGQTAAADAG